MVSKATFSRWKIAIMEMVKKLPKANPLQQKLSA